MTSYKQANAITGQSGNRFRCAGRICATVSWLRNSARLLPCDRRPVRQSSSRKAFTLIELVIVILILGIMAAVAAPRYRDSLTYFRVEAAAQRIAADLSYAQRLAKQGGMQQSVEFTLASNAYTLSGVSDPDHPLQDYTVDLSRTQYPASLATVDFDGKTTVTFDMYGQPYCGTPLNPLTAGSVVVQVGTEQRTITIDPVTGKASVQ